MAENDKVNAGFGKFKNKIAAAIEDLSSLQVSTYTGDLVIEGKNLITTEEGKPMKFNTKSILDHVQKQGNIKFKLVGYTYIDVDSDTVNFVKEDLTEDDRVLVEAHKTMVQASQESRMAFLNLVKELIKGK
ncbi:MAG: hypothetical protein KTR26_12045 [Flammeovirgaceae bacterium]|nr:hypothetical protein [Flammeovirgaceae bacterium]